jgi:protein gp37
VDKKIYGLADKAWQVVVGCDPRMPCAPRCWARKTVARIVRCQEKEHPHRSAFFQVALSPDGKQWSGQTFLDEAHLSDPLKWRKPALIATGFHGDIGRLGTDDMEKILRVACSALRNGHRIMFLTKMPVELRRQFTFAMNRIYGNGHWYPPDGITVGCSVMNQSEADRQRNPMAELAAMGWSTHVWYEPAIGRVNWQGWEFIKLLIVGGESGANARPFVDNWAYVSLDWCQQHDIKFWMKQLGANPVDSLGKMRGTMFLKTDRSGSRLESLPGLLRVRELPETFRRATAEVPR